MGLVTVSQGTLNEDKPDIGDASLLVPSEHLRVSHVNIIVEVALWQRWAFFGRTEVAVPGDPCRSNSTDGA